MKQFDFVVQTSVGIHADQIKNEDFFVGFIILDEFLKSTHW